MRLLALTFVLLGTLSVAESSSLSLSPRDEMMRRLSGQGPSENYNDELEQCDEDCEKYEKVAKFFVDKLAENTVACKWGGKTCSAMVSTTAVAACNAIGMGPASWFTWGCSLAVSGVSSMACTQICEIVKPTNLEEAVKQSKLAKLAHELAMRIAPMCLSEEEKKNHFLDDLDTLPDQTRCGLCVKEKDRWLLESCHKCKNKSSIWYSHGAVRACGKPKQLKYGERCNMLDTCLNCEPNPKTGKLEYGKWWAADKFACGIEKPSWKDGKTCWLGTSCKACINDATWWWGNWLVKCGKEPLWKDGSRCAAGSSCKMCKNSWSYWHGKLFTACGKEPCWGKNTKCWGTACRQCCNGSEQRWYWFGFGYCK